MGWNHQLAFRRMTTCFFLVIRNSGNLNEPPLESLESLETHASHQEGEMMKKWSWLLEIMLP